MKQSTLYAPANITFEADAGTVQRRFAVLSIAGAAQLKRWEKRMARIAAWFTFVWTLAFAPLANSADKPLKCDTGPLNKTYGKTEWVVYSCADNRTVVIHSASGNPAMPFYFMFFPKEKEGGYKLYGEGTGRKEATAAAYEELKVLSASDIAALIQQTKAVQKQKRND